MTSRLGVATASLVSCKKSEYHGFHPANEVCRYCGPDDPKKGFINVKINVEKSILPGFPGWVEYEPGSFAPSGYKAIYKGGNGPLTARMVTCKEDLPTSFMFIAPSGTTHEVFLQTKGYYAVLNGLLELKNANQMDILLWLKKIPCSP